MGWGFFGAGMAQGVGHGVNLVRQFDSLRRDANEYQRKQQERDILDGGELPPASIGMRPEKQPEPQDLGVTANPVRMPGSLARTDLATGDSDADFSIRQPRTAPAAAQAGRADTPVLDAWHGPADIHDPHGPGGPMPPSQVTAGGVPLIEGRNRRLLRREDAGYYGQPGFVPDNDLVRANNLHHERAERAAAIQEKQGLPPMPEQAKIGLRDATRTPTHDRPATNPDQRLPLPDRSSPYTAENPLVTETRLDTPEQAPQSRSLSDAERVNQYYEERAAAAFKAGRGQLGMQLWNAGAGARAQLRQERFHDVRRQVELTGSYEPFVQYHNSTLGNGVHLDSIRAAGRDANGQPLFEVRGRSLLSGQSFSVMHPKSQVDRYVSAVGDPVASARLEAEFAAEARKKLLEVEAANAKASHQSALKDLEPATIPEGQSRYYPRTGQTVKGPAKQERWAYAQGRDGSPSFLYDQTSGQRIPLGGGVGGPNERKVTKAQEDARQEARAMLSRADVNPDVWGQVISTTDRLVAVAAETGYSMTPGMAANVAVLATVGRPPTATERSNPKAIPEGMGLDADGKVRLKPFVKNEHTGEIRPGYFVDGRPLFLGPPIPRPQTRPQQPPSQPPAREIRDGDISMRQAKPPSDSVIVEREAMEIEQGKRRDYSPEAKAAMQRMEEARRRGNQEYGERERVEQLRRSREAARSSFPALQ